MATAWSALRARLRVRVGDTVADYQTSDATLLASYGNPAQDKIHRLEPSIQAGTFLTADAILPALEYASRNSFDLTDTDQIGATFLEVELVSIPSADGLVINPFPDGIEAVRRAQISEQLVEGTPSGYATQNKSLVFDRLIADPTIIYVDYLAKATAMTLDSSTLSGFLADGFDDLFLDVMEEMLCLDIGSDRLLGRLAGTRARIYGPKLQGGGELTEYANYIHSRLSRRTPRPGRLVQELL